MSEGSPENDAWLQDLVDTSSLFPEARLRAHWRNVVPWLPVSARYELAAILLEVEQATPCA